MNDLKFNMHLPSRYVISAGRAKDVGDEGTRRLYLAHILAFKVYSWARSVSTML